MPEPTVLDYVKAKLTFWRPNSLHLPKPEEETFGTEAEPTPEAGRPEESIPQGLAEQPFTAGIPTLSQENQSSAPFQIGAAVQTAPAEAQAVQAHGSFPWRTLLALVFAVCAQMALNPPGSHVSVGAFLYAMAAWMTMWGVVSHEWSAAPRPAEEIKPLPVWFRRNGLIAAIILAVLTFLLFHTGEFNPFNLTVWLVTIAVFVYTFWETSNSWRDIPAKLRRFFSPAGWQINISPWWILILASILLAVFFRFYQLNTLPPEMVSDHAEKLLDVQDVLAGKTAVFFPRNSGREFIEFYLAAGMILLFKTGLSFITLKLVMSICGILVLPYMYLLGKEIANRRVGLIAMTFTGISYWSIVVSRIGLRGPLYATFAAPTLYYLLRGLRTSRRNDFIISGLFLGLSLHGYSSSRMMPLIVVAAVLLFVLSRQSKGARWQAVVGVIILGAVAFAVFLPLFRYAVDNPEAVAGRALSRLGSTEQAIPGPVILVFLSNLWNGIIMYFWSGGDVWVHSIPYYPAFDTISAALLLLGVVLVLLRFLRSWHWRDLFLLISIPLVLMPSILSLAFPNENPALTRGSAGIVPAFVLVGIAFDALMSAIEKGMPLRAGKRTAWALAAVLLFISATTNYDLVFNKYLQQFVASAWNVSEMGGVISGFTHSIGSPDSAWVVTHPYWVDTRLVGVEAGYGPRDFALDPHDIASTVTDQHPKLFIVDLEDADSQAILQKTYPTGFLEIYKSKVQGKDFDVFTVPAPPGNVAP